MLIKGTLRPESILLITVRETLEYSFELVHLVFIARTQMEIHLKINILYVRKGLLFQGNQIFCLNIPFLTNSTSTICTQIASCVLLNFKNYEQTFLKLLQRPPVYKELSGSNTAYKS